jgi:hypothetical protein
LGLCDFALKSSRFTAWFRLSESKEYPVSRWKRQDMLNKVAGISRPSRCQNEIYVQEPVHDQGHSSNIRLMFSAVIGGASDGASSNMSPPCRTSRGFPKLPGRRMQPRAEETIQFLFLFQRQRLGGRPNFG